MIFHLSIAADEPQRVANVLAELFGGEALPFPVFEGAWLAHAGDDRNTLIEVYQAGMELVPSDGMHDAQGRYRTHPSLSTSTHAAIATELTETEVKAIAKREGWTAKTLCRGGVFHVIEFWLENAILIEVLTAEMQAEYLSGMTLEGWKKALSAQRAA